MNIRLIQEIDKEAVLEMMITFYHSPAVIENVSKEVLLQNIDNCLSNMPFIIGFVFYEKEVMIGYAMIAKSYSTEFGGICLWVEDIYIKPPYQGKGLAKEFFLFLENTYSQDVVRFRLELASCNENALKSYEKSGYRKLSYVQMSKEV